jgi:hypothetical protein
MFLKELYSKWKGMFYFVLVFICVQAFIMYKRVETIPFFIFDLYSGKAHLSDKGYYDRYYLNGNYFDTRKLSSREQETLLGSYDYYLHLKANGFYATDTTTIHNRFYGRLPVHLYKTVFDRLTNRQVNDSIYLYWWRKYFMQVSHLQIASIVKITSSIYYKPEFKVMKDTISIIKYEFR